MNSHSAQSDLLGLEAKTVFLTLPVPLAKAVLP